MKRLGSSCHPCHRLAEPSATHHELGTLVKEVAVGVSRCINKCHEVMTALPPLDVVFVRAMAS